MIMDNLLIFSSGQAITATADSTNQLDFLVGRDMGVGDDPIWLSVQSIAAFATLTSLQITLSGAPDNGSGAPGTYVPLVSSNVILLAALTASTDLWKTPLPLSGPTTRFLKLTYTVGGANATAGSVSAQLTLDVNARYTYAEGANVSSI